MANKILFFLRHYNDIDHIVPVIYKWLQSGSSQAYAIIATDPSYQDDYRIQFLLHYENFHLFHIQDFFNKGQRARFRRNANLTDLAPLHPFRLWNKIREVFFAYQRFPDYDRQFFERVYGLIFGDGEKGVVAFDWLSTNSPHLGFVEMAVETARERGLVSISLPHGDSPHYNRMIRINELDYSSDEHYASGSIFDFVVVPNDLCARRYRPFLEQSRIKVLGSPRYNQEWLSVLDNLIGPYEHHASDGKLKIVLFLRSYLYPIFWEEVVRSIQLITQFEKVFLVVKHHMRDAQLNKVLDKYPELKNSHFANLEIVFQEIHSGSLLKWADIVIDVGTSVAFEAVKLRKPVLAAEYLHADFSTVAHYIGASNLQCRDDLYDVISAFIDNPRAAFYNEEQREKFIREMIEVQGLDVLGSYNNFLSSLFSETSGK